LKDALLRCPRPPILLLCFGSSRELQPLLIFSNQSGLGRCSFQI